MRKRKLKSKILLKIKNENPKTEIIFKLGGGIMIVITEEDTNKMNKALDITKYILT